MIELKDIKNFIIFWNNSYPLDKWWRDKYKISIFSNLHLELNYVNVLLEYEEDKLYKTFIKEIKEDKEDEEYIPGTGNYLKKEVTSYLSEEDFLQIKI